MERMVTLKTKFSGEIKATKLVDGKNSRKCQAYKAFAFGHRTHFGIVGWSHTKHTWIRIHTDGERERGAYIARGIASLLCGYIKMWIKAFWAHTEYRDFVLFFFSLLVPFAPYNTRINSLQYFIIWICSTKYLHVLGTALHTLYKMCVFFLRAARLPHKFIQFWYAFFQWIL